MDDLIYRLRKKDEYEPVGHDAWEAADEIVTLRYKCQRYYELLRECQSELKSHFNGGMVQEIENFLSNEKP